MARFMDRPDRYFVKNNYLLSIFNVVKFRPSCRQGMPASRAQGCDPPAAFPGIWIRAGLSYPAQRRADACRLPSGGFAVQNGNRADLSGRHKSASGEFVRHNTVGNRFGPL